MYCNNCGAKVDLDSNYCEKCGHKLNTPVTGDNSINEIIKEEKEVKEKIIIKKRIPINLLVSLILLIVGLGILLYCAGKQIDELRDQKVVKDINEPSTSTGNCEYTIDVDSNFSFGVKLESSEESSITVKDEDDNVVKVQIESNFDEVFIHAPDEGYKENTLYKITIKNGRFLKEEYNKYNDVCFKVKKEEVNNIKEEESFMIGTYTYKENTIVLNKDNTFIMTYLDNEEKTTIQGTYKVENYVLVLNGSNDITYNFNINNNKEISSLDIIGNSSYNEIGTIYTYKG